MYYRVNDQPVMESYVGETKGDKKFTKGEVISFYIFISAILSLIGFFVAKELGVVIGLAIGIMLSVILWVTWGKKHTK